MKKVWCKLAICEQDVALEVTGYQSSEIEIVIGQRCMSPRSGHIPRWLSSAAGWYSIVSSMHVVTRGSARLTPGGFDQSWTAV
jgi:hypothetical protein